MRNNSNRNAVLESQALSAAVRNGDRPGIERLVVAHRDYLKRVVSLRMNRRLQARVDPSDVVQETQLEAVQRVNEFLDNPELPLRLWLRRLACDAVVDAQRRHIHAEKRSMKREMFLPERSSLNMGRQLLAGVSTPSRQFSKKELAQMVREAVERLSADDREVVLLLAFEGLNSTEAGHVLDVEPATVRKRYGRALLKLQAQFDRGVGEAHV